MVSEVIEVNGLTNSSVEDKKMGSRRNQFLISVAVCLPFFAYGSSMGWISANKALLMSKSSPTDSPLSEEDISWMASIMFIFAPIAVFFYGAAADKYGRKITLISISIPMLLSGILMLVSTHPIAFIVARALMGFGAGGGFVVCSLYVKEISEDSIRGMTGTFPVFSQTVGNLFAYIIDDLLSFYPVLWILMAIPAVHIIVMCLLPETPPFLIRCDKIKETAKVLGLLRSLPANDESISEEVDKLIKEKTVSHPKFSPKTVYADKTAMKAFWLVLIVDMTRELCGCIALLFYASHIFAEAGKDPDTNISLSPNKQSLMLAIVTIIGSFVACQLVDRTGRKPLLVVTSLIAGLSMCLLGVWFYLQSIHIFLSGWVPIVALCVSIFADAAGLQPLPYVIMTEMFSFQLRGTVSTLITAVSLTADFALLKLFAPLNSWIGYHSTFWIFSIICFLNVFFFLYCVPETKMRSLEDIYAELEGKKEIRKNEEIVETSHV